ncbi:MAG: hypothetical protein P4M00_06890 [Azospirillaceae bacterium]|nr:hypothetical protein [Azospirillaceae bacterium]
MLNVDVELNHLSMQGRVRRAMRPGTVADDEKKGLAAIGQSARLIRSLQADGGRNLETIVAITA